MNLEIEQTGETGKAWPHGEREPRRKRPEQTDAFRFRAPLDQDTRLKLATLRDEAYAAGKLDGREEAHDEFRYNGAASLCIGAMSGALVLWGLQAAYHWITRTP